MFGGEGIDHVVSSSLSGAVAWPWCGAEEGSFNTRRRGDALRWGKLWGEKQHLPLADQRHRSSRVVVGAPQLGR